MSLNRPLHSFPFVAKEIDFPVEGVGQSARVAETRAGHIVFVGIGGGGALPFKFHSFHFSTDSRLEN